LHHRGGSEGCRSRRRIVGFATAANAAANSAANAAAETSRLESARRRSGRFPKALEGCFARRDRAERRHGEPSLPQQRLECGREQGALFSVCCRAKAAR
jgi:hypothetical protein